MDVGKIIGWNVKRLRSRLGLTQAELSLRIDLVNQAYVSDLEKGKRNPTAILLALIARSLGATVGELFQTEGVPKEHVSGDIEIKSSRSKKSSA